MRKYSHILASFFYIILIISLVACGKTTYNGLMKDATPNTSALTYYIYDGEFVRRSLTFDTNTKQSILDKLDRAKAIEAENWSLEDITLPIYGLEIGSADGTNIFAAWSNGYWISQDGTVYSLDFDFAGLEQNYIWPNEDKFHSFAVFPCARFLTQDENGWNRTLLTPAIDLSPPEGIILTLEAQNNDGVTINILNESGAEWSYGDTFGLQVLLEGVWYDIPTIPGNWGFSAISYVIQDGEEQSKTYNLTMYGKLPLGNYRLVTKDLSVEFMIS